MNKNDQQRPQGETGLQKDEKKAALRLSSPAPLAGGIGAIVNTLKHTARSLGIGPSYSVLSQMNQLDGFDCPGCAWPDPAERSQLELCENGAKAVAHEGTRERIYQSFFETWSLSDLKEKSERWLEAQGRLTTPQFKAEGENHYSPISWQDAFQKIATQLHSLSSPDEAVFYTSGRTSNEAAFLLQLLARQFGTNNLPDCSNLCHESSGKGLSKVLGVGKGTVDLKDFELADAIFVIGQNPGTNHPRMLTTLADARKRGCKIICINPLKEPGLVRFKHPKRVSHLVGRGAPIANLYLQVRINGDVALLKGISKAVLEAENKNTGQILDHAFIHENSTGFSAFSGALADVSWDDIVRISGIPEADIRQAADIYIASKNTIACWAMGLTQHKNAIANVQEVVNLLLLKGNLGRDGAGVCPVRGHSNVQGNRTMGIWESPSTDFLQRLGDALSFTPPRKHGYSAVETLDALNAGDVKLFFAMGGNFISASPDTDYTVKGMARCNLSVQVSTKLNRSHLYTGKEALILPCLGRTDKDLQNGDPQWVSVENSMSIVHASQGQSVPPSESLMSEPAIICHLAEQVIGEFAGDSQLNHRWRDLAEDYSKIRDLIAQSIHGFEDYNYKIEENRFFVLPNSARNREFNTESGRAEFTVHPLTEIPLDPGQLLLMTIRSHDQYNTTIYTNDDRYRGVFGDRRVLFINPGDLKKLEYAKNRKLTITSHFNGETRTVTGFTAVPYDIPEGCLAAYFPETNPLIPASSRADISKTPTSKSVVVTLTPETD